MLQVEGRDVMIESLQAKLEEVGFFNVKLSLDDNLGVMFAMRTLGASSLDVRRGIWKAVALTYPTTYPCWICFQSRHCASCACCP